LSALTLVIGNKNYSSWSLRPWIFLNFFEIPFEEKRVALFTDSSDQELEPYSSNLKVPVLLDGELIVWDSLSILEYLSENYLSGAGWPVDKEARAFARSLSSEMHSSFNALRDALPMNCRKSFSNIQLSDDAKNDISRVNNLWNIAHEKFGKEGDWIMGQFSIVDAMYIPVALRFHGYGIKCQGYAKDYIETVLQNKYIKQWIAAGKLEKEVIEMDEI